MSDADTKQLEANGVSLMEALAVVQDEISWAADAITVFQNVKDVYLKAAGVADPQPSAVELLDKVKDLEKFLTVDLECHIAQRDGRRPFYLAQVLKLCQKARDVIGTTNAQTRQLDHLSAELQATFGEYGFCLNLDPIYEIGEATRHLEALSLKLDKCEKSVRSKQDAGSSLAELHSAIANLNGIQQAMTPANISRMQPKFDAVTGRVLALENNISSSNIRADSEFFIRYLAGQHLLRKPFISKIYRSDSEAVVNAHMIHPGTRGWILEKVERWLYKTEKRVFFIAADEGAGKTALSSAICKLFCHDVVASHFLDGKATASDPLRNKLLGVIQSISSDLCRTLPEYLNYLDDKFGSREVTGESAQDWQKAYNVLLKDPLQTLYGTGKTASVGARRKLIVIDGLSECVQGDWNDLKSFFHQFVNDFSSSFGLLITVRSKHAGSLLPSVKALDTAEGLCFEDRAWVNRHIKDIEVYLSSSLGAILSGEDAQGTPKHAKADDSTLHNAIDELLKCSAGRFDYAIELMESFAREMSSSSQFLTSLKKATAPVRSRHGDTFERNMSDFSSPYRAYRDKEGRSVNVRVLRQSHYLMDKTRVALIRGRHQIHELSKQ